MRHLIVGARGQDGRYLEELLWARGDRVYGLDKDGLHEGEAVLHGAVDLCSKEAVASCIAEIVPEHVYYLAACHHSAEQDVAANGDPLQISLDVQVRGLANIFNGITRHAPKARLFYAGSSHMYKASGATLIDEMTPISPNCVYGITKTAGVHYCRMMREMHGLFVSVGLLFNHESPLRPPHFLSSKLVRGAYDALEGRQDHITLATLDAQVDWGFAGDYVEAMWSAMSHDKPEDFVIASGELHTVRQLAEKVFGFLGLDGRDHIRLDEKVLKKGPVPAGMRGETAKIRRLTGWKPAHDLDGLVDVMMKAEKERRARG